MLLQRQESFLDEWCLITPSPIETEERVFAESEMWLPPSLPESTSSDFSSSDESYTDGEVYSGSYAFFDSLSPCRSYLPSTADIIGNCDIMKFEPAAISDGICTESNRTTIEGLRFKPCHRRYKYKLA